MAFLENAVICPMLLTRQFNSSDESGGALPFSWQQQAFIDQPLAAGRWLLVLLVAWLLWRKAVRPQLTRRAEAVKTVQQQAQAREEVEDSGGSPSEQRRTTPTTAR